VYLLWHARHLVIEDDGSTVHTDPDGNPHLDEEEWRLLGVFRDEATAIRPPASCPASATSRNAS
jgi:hypothetical protein